MRMDNKINLSKRYILPIISIFIMAFVLCVIVACSYYTVFRGDDFTHATGVGVFGGPVIEFLKACFNYTKRMYLEWQGTYFSMFIQALLSPLNNWGLVQLQGVMFLNSLTFILSFVLFLWAVVGKIIEEHIEIKLLICASVLWLLFNTRAYTEVFFWYSGATSYSIPLTCLFLSLTLLIKPKKKKNVYTILAAVFGFCAVGGSLTISGVACYSLFMIILFYWISERKIPKVYFIMFSVYMIGALINAIAPGNFIRHTAMDDSLHPIEAFIYTLSVFKDEFVWLFQETSLLIFVAVFIVCGMLCHKKIVVKMKLYFIISGILGLAPIVAIFPVAMGYHSIAYFPNRCLFVADLLLEIAVLNGAFAVGCFIGKYLCFTYYKYVFISLLIVILGFSIVKKDVIYKPIVMHQAEKLLDGSIPAYYNRCAEIVNEIQNSAESNVVITGFPDPIEYFTDFVLSDNPKDWVNKGMATFYNKESIRRE